VTLTTASPFVVARGNDTMGRGTLRGESVRNEPTACIGNYIFSLRRYARAVRRPIRQAASSHRSKPCWSVPSLQAQRTFYCRAAGLSLRSNIRRDIDAESRQFGVEVGLVEDPRPKECQS
jgi:hypothetical protein